MIRNKRWTLRNGNQVLRDRYQKELAVVYPDNTMTFLGQITWWSTQEAARDAAEKMALDAGYRLSPVGLQGRWGMSDAGATTNDQTAMLHTLFGARLSSVKLKGRQRSRKGVRLGRRGRRLALAASIGEALDATKHWRGK